MKARLLILYATGVLTLNVQAGVYSGTGGSIPDGKPTGWATTVTVSGERSVITDVNVTLSISGGYNGDLYAYLSYDGALLPLLNRAGKETGSGPTYWFGYGDAGFDGVTLADGGAMGNIHNYGGGSVPTGTYSPDSGGLTFAEKFGGKNPNGTWTLFFADLSSGQQSTLGSWSLNIMAVPEPVNVALGVLAGLFLVVALARNKHVRNRIYQWRVAVTHWIDAV
jgi:hypothetical protein